MDIFRKMFGLNRDDEQYHRHRRDNERNNFFNDADQDPFSRRGFDVFTDPLQMHQYFEQQMNELLRNFGFQEFGNFSSEFPNIPSLDDHPFENHSELSQDPRDQFLKPGYEKAKRNHSEMIDKDLDEKMKSGNFDSLVTENNENTVAPHTFPKGRSHFYGFSHGSRQSMKSVTNPDGTIETHRTVRDTEGNEETSVCHRMGNKEYCIIKRRDKEGKEETTEQFVNMSEDEKDIFFKPKKKIQN